MQTDSTAQRLEQEIVEPTPLLGEPTAYTILLVEDNKGEALLIRSMLQNTFVTKHVRFIVASRLNEALDMLSHMHFDTIILDLNLPDADGIASVAALRSCKRDIPLIVHTGNSRPALREEAMLCGANYFWLKGRESSIFFKSLVRQALADNSI